VPPPLKRAGRSPAALGRDRLVDSPLQMVVAVVVVDNAGVGDIRGGDRALSMRSSKLALRELSNEARKRTTPELREEAGRENTPKGRRMCDLINSNGTFCRIN